MHMLRKFYQNIAIAYMNTSGNISLFRFESIPIHLGEDIINIKPDELYKVLVSELNTEGTSYKIKIIQSVGMQGDISLERSLYEQYNKRQFDDFLTEEQQKQLTETNGFKYLNGKLKVQISGQQVVQTTTHNELFKFENRTNDFNRAIHGCDVTFMVKPPKEGQNPKNHFI